MIKSFIDVHSDIVYYNGVVTNNQNVTLPIKLNDTRADPIIENPSDEWEMSVVRFNIENGFSIPLTIVGMQPGAVAGVFSDSVLSFTMVYLGIDYQGFVQLDKYNAAYGGSFIGTYQELLDELNTCLANIFASLAGPPPSITTPPMFVYDSETQVISIYFEENYALVGDVEVWMNLPTNNLLLGYPLTTYDLNGLNGKVSRINFNTGYAKQAPALALGNRVGFPLITNTIPDNMRYFPQDAVLITSWNSVRNIFLTTNSLPVQSEYNPTQNGNINNSSFGNSYLNIISDFLMNPDNNPQKNRIDLIYLPSAEYRMIKLKGREPVKRVNIEVFMTITNGIVVPVLIEPGTTFSVKLMFRRKY